MQTAAKKSRFFIKSPSLKLLTDLQVASKPGEFYQLITQGLIKGIHTKQVLVDLADKLVTFAECAYQSRQMETLEQVSNILLNLPLGREFEGIGYYYQALCIKRYGQVAEARLLLERVAEKAPLRYRARAIQSLGITFIQSNDFQIALPLFTEVGKVIKRTDVIDPLVVIPTQQAIAVLKSIDGDHRGALTYLKNMLPLFHSAGPVYPPMYYAYLNSLAVEMTELGRLKEARYLSNIVLASPYVNAYPEWRETSDDIERKGYRQSRSFVPITQGVTEHNIIRLPERENISVSQGEPARILHYNWENRMVKQPDDETKIEDLEGMSENDLMVKLLYLATNKGVTENKLRKVVSYALKVFSEPEG